MSNTNVLLPTSWIKTNLGSVLEYGKVEKAEPNEIHNDTWVLELEDIEKDNSKIIQRLTFLDRQSKSTKNKFKEGDVLYGKLRPYLNKVVIADSDGVCTTEVIPLTGNAFLSNKYLFYWLKHPSFLAYVTQVGYGVNMPRLGTKDGIAAPFILAPIAEQQQITAKLDELLAQVDSIKTRLDAIPKILKRFRQSVVAAAVSGKLTEDWRQSADQFDVTSQIEAILTDRQTISGNKKKPVNHLINEEFEIPPGWKWVSLDALSAKIVDGTHHTPTYVENGVPFISVKDIKNGNIDFSDTKFITKDEHEELCKRCNPEIGDLLITKSGTIGRTAIVNTENEFSLFVSVALIKPASKKCNMHFINLALQKWVNEIDVSSRIVGSAIKNLHLVDMRVLAIPFPSIQEQTEIVRRIEQLFTYADQIEQRVKDAQSRVNHLTQSILAKAFRGELTADWRVQNPDLISGENSAEALLNNIQLERSAENTKSKSIIVRMKTRDSMTPKKIIPVYEALRAAGKALSGQELLKSAGYPSDVSTQQLEQFFLDIRQQLELKTIIRNRRENSDQDWFEVNKSEG